MSEQDIKISPHHSATFREYILLPRRTEPRSALGSVNLGTNLGLNFPLNIPFLSAAMESVTGHRLAIALALQGGLSILPAGRVELVSQLEMIGAVKSYRGGVVEHVHSVRGDATLAELDLLEERFNVSHFPVTDRDDTFLGAICSTDYHPIDERDILIRKKMRPPCELLLFQADSTGEEMEKRLLESSHRYGYRVNNENRLSTLICRRQVKHELRYQNALRDRSSRLRVGAAISTHPEDRERARLCVAAGADLLSVDASDGFSDYMKQTLEAVTSLGVPVIAGNVVDRAGFEFLAECGADAVKIGIGSGSICTTRRVKAIGRGQATAVHLIAQARDEWAQKTGRYIPLISDGGLAGTGDMSVALALGADALMMGKYFAGFDESPTTAYSKKMRIEGDGASLNITVKPYWGEASARAKNVRRYQQDDPRTFVVEGEEGYVLSKGSLHEGLPRDLKAIKGTLSSCGCRDLQEFRREVMLERQSIGSQQEGGTSILQG